MLTIPTVIILEFAVLAMTLTLEACVLYQILRMRDAHAEQRTEFIRAIAALKDFANLHPQMVALIQRLEPLQTAPPEAPAPMEPQQERLANSVNQHESALMRKGVLSQDPELRFLVLKDWVTKNSLAMVRRAARGWKTADDLIAMIPAALETQAEVVGRVLLIGTRGHSEKLAVAIRELGASSEITQLLDVISISPTTSTVPAFLPHPMSSARIEGTRGQPGRSDE